MGKAAHLSRRFFTSLWPAGPKHTDGLWAESHLLESEVGLWRRMSRVDRRHAVGVARRVDVAFEGEADRAVLAAALLHDLGKIEARLGTYGRVVATLSAAVAGRDAAYDWVRTSGYTRRIGLYLLHPKLGGDHLALAGSHPLTEAWTREHHLPESEWTVDTEVGRVLREADDD